VEVPAPDKGDTERRMIGAASSSSSGTASASAAAASSSAAAAAAAEAEEDEGPKVDETQLERLYRLNEQAYMTLPEFEGPVRGLRGLELRPYQRQALAWMLRREAGVEDGDKGDAAEEEGGGVGDGPGRAGKRRRSGAGQALGVHLDVGLKEEEEEEDEDVVEIVGDPGPSLSVARAVGSKSSSSSSGSSSTQVWLHQGLVQVAPATAKRLAHVSTFHPLWDRHFLALPLECGYNDGRGAPVQEKGLGFPLPFFSNPYSKQLSLAIPPPPRPCLGGVLADDMVWWKGVWGVMPVSCILW
jgi:hypothetical protein